MSGELLAALCRRWSALLRVGKALEEEEEAVLRLTEGAVDGRREEGGAWSLLPKLGTRPVATVAWEGVWPGEILIVRKGVEGGGAFP
jgi:hypothetical protein